MERAIILSVAVAVVFVAANVLTEKSLEPGRAHIMVWVWLLACLGFGAQRWCYQAFGLSVAAAVIDSLLTLLTVGYGIFILKDRLTPMQYIGITLMLIGIFLVKPSASSDSKKGADEVKTPTTEREA
jgi:drug/metabolite transporter (DMT)-like permease